MKANLRALPSKALLPTLDALLKDPAAAAQLQHQDTVDLLAKNAALQAILTVRLLALRSEASQRAQQIEPFDEMLTVEEAAPLLRRSRRWIWRNKRKLPFVRQVSAKSLLCSKNGVAAWLASCRVLDS